MDAEKRPPLALTAAPGAPPAAPGAASRSRRRSTALLLAAGALFSLSSFRGAAARAGELPYPPDQERPGTILHVPTGLPLDEEGALAVLAGARLVAVGEVHDNIRAHEVELAIIRGLERRFPGRVAIGMEMFRTPQQPALDRYVRGETDERTFLRESRWFANWGSDFDQYRPILEFARDRRIDVIALNPPKELETAARTGFADLSPELRRALPEFGPTDPYQRAMLEALYAGHMRSREGLEKFLRVQLLWEEYMAERVVGYLRSPRGEGKRIVTLTGGWHVEYGFGVPKKVFRRMPLPYAVVFTDEVESPEDRPERRMDVTLPPVPLLPADVIFFVGFADPESREVKLGARLGEREGRVVVESVEAGSAAAKAGISAGDAIVAVEGDRVADLADFQALLAPEKRPGGSVRLTIRKPDEGERTVSVEWPRPVETF